MLMRETQSQWGAEALEIWTWARGTHRGTQRGTQRGTWNLAQRNLPDPQRGVMAVVMAVDARTLSPAISRAARSAASLNRTKLNLNPKA